MTKKELTAGTDITEPKTLGRGAATDDGGSQQNAAESGMAMAPDGVERLALAFERSARRWEMIVYPAMIIFTIFAAYGFYQVHTLSRDMRSVAGQLEPQMGVHMTRLTGSMRELSDNISKMSQSIGDMQEKVAQMSGDLRVMTTQMKHLKSIDAQMYTMNRSIRTMAMHTNTIRWNMASMNRNISKPMSLMNSFMPW